MEARKQKLATKNKRVMFVLIGIAGCLSLFPLYTKLTQTESFYYREDSLPKNALIRGPFLNSGTRDAGLDPNYHKRIQEKFEIQHKE